LHLLSPARAHRAGAGAALAGQDYDYLLRLLRGFKAKTASDLDGTMTIATQPLGDEEIGPSCTTSRASPPSRSRPR